jgi:hypothetical protein
MKEEMKVEERKGEEGTWKEKPTPGCLNAMSTSNKGLKSTVGPSTSGPCLLF